jgi:hypothetical protein
MSNQDKPTGKVTRAEMEVALDQVLEMLPVLLRRAGADAQLLKAKYDALVATGFTADQALAIVKARPLYE